MKMTFWCMMRTAHLDVLDSSELVSIPFSEVPLLYFHMGPWVSVSSTQLRLLLVKHSPGITPLRSDDSQGALLF